MVATISASDNPRAFPSSSSSAAIRTHHAEGKMAKKWPLHYLIRHTAYHTLDHTWEMEDRDLTIPAQMQPLLSF